mgnify:CR=1 FL=1
MNDKRPTTNEKAASESEAASELPNAPNNLNANVV